MITFVNNTAVLNIKSFIIYTTFFSCSIIALTSNKGATFKGKRLQSEQHERYCGPATKSVAML